MAPINLGERPPDEMPPSLTCSASLKDAKNGERISLLLKGDTDAFFQGIDLSSGTVSVRIPLQIVVRDTVTFDEQSASLIILASAGPTRRAKRKRNLRKDSTSQEPHRNLQTGTVATTGQMKVVIVRLSNDNSNDAKTIAAKPYQIMTDFFSDENNLASVYQACSNGLLTFVPAWGKDTVKYKDPVTKKTATTGVVNITPPSNICSMDWRDAGNYALAQMAKMSYWATHKVIILPDCVNFNGAAGKSHFDFVYTI